MSTQYVERTETTTTSTGDGISLQSGYLRTLKAYLKIGEMVGSLNYVYMFYSTGVMALHDVDILRNQNASLLIIKKNIIRISNL